MVYLINWKEGNEKYTYGSNRSLKNLKEVDKSLKELKNSKRKNFTLSKMKNIKKIKGGYSFTEVFIKKL